MNRQGKLLGAQFHELEKSEKFLAVILLGAALSCYFCSLYFRFANKMSMGVHPAESYIINGSSQNNFTCTILFPMMLLTFDAPFLGERSLYEIARVGRRQWLISKILFLFLEVFLYNLFTFAVTVVFSLFSVRNLVFENWSEAMTVLARTGGGPYLSFPYQDFVAALSPWTGALLTCLFNSAYCLVLAFVMLLCNLRLGSTKGWPVAMAIHILGYVTGNSAFRGFDFSLLNCAFPAGQIVGESWMDALRSAVLFVLLMVFLLIPTIKSEKRLVP